MPRKKTFSEDQFPYHVTARSRNKEWFEFPLIDVWDHFSQQLYMTTLTYGVRVHAFVLMSNHFHLLMIAPHGNLDPAMSYLLLQVTKALNATREDSEDIFECPYHASIIKHRAYYEFAYKYVYRNPIEARLCNRVESYSYSTLRGFLGLDKLSFPAFDNMNLISDPVRQLSWLNSPFPSIEYLNNIREALRQREFELVDL